ncbi:glycoside hydrolase family 38 C-terminal domain-containing protein [Bacteroides propionicifaciens]|uniref:glycoside hydrolase family 38 N-terminal domain-containing protein n=1 Tax=Bacteroides propionicifaciens TaxID=392838 RepID=UPI000377A5AF|nr:glycoside hydrolase family 38 C-terminal domain-containing protein [Bacteroides propionicifaciens]
MKNRILLLLILTIMAPPTWAFPQKSGQLVQGYEKELSGTRISYESHVPTANEALINRTIPESKPIEWESQVISSTKGLTTFVFTLGVTRIKPGTQSADYHLFLNGDKLITFNLTSNNQWVVKGIKESSFEFEQYYKDARDDLFGYAFLTIPSKYLEADKPVTFKISSDKSDKNDWLMVFKTPIQDSVEALATQTVLKHSKKQIIQITYSHFDKPGKVRLDFNNISITEPAKFGINHYQLAIDPINKKASYPLSIANNGAKVKTTVNFSPYRNWKVNFVQHTHTDIGYTRPQHEILSEHMRFIDYALDYCDQTDDYPEDAKFRFTLETSWSVSEYLRTRPKEQVERLKRRIKEGRIEATAMYFNFDELPSENDLTNSLYPLEVFKQEDIKVQTAMQNDVNGVGWNFAETLPDLGIKYLIMGTHGHKALISFDIPTAFWWESPSGKKMLAYRAEHYNHGNFLQIEKGNFENFEKRMLKYLEDLAAKNYPHDIASAQYSGYFTDNSPPSIAGSEIVKMWNEKYEYPKLRIPIASEFMEEIEKNYANELDTYCVAWPDWWTDGFGSAAREVAFYRYAQSDIISNEVMLSLAKILGAKLSPTLDNEIAEANKALLFYGEHTFGFHASVREPFNKETMQQRSHKGAYAWESYRRTRPIGETALGLMQSYVPRQKDNASIIVFNPMSWHHSGVTTIYADHEVLPINQETIIRDHNGKEVKKQIVRSYADASYWDIWVDDIAPLGSMYYTIEHSKKSPNSKSATYEFSGSIENQWYSIEVDTKSGTITKWYDKELGQNLLSDQPEWKMGELIYETDDVRGALDQFKPGNFKHYSPTNVRFASFQEGDIWDTYKFIGTTPAGMGEDNFTVELQVFKTAKQINLTYLLNKKLVTDPEAVYVSFPFELTDGKIFFDVAGGSIQAGVDQLPGSANDWNTVQSFASVRNKDAQILIASKEIPLMQFGNINLGRFKAGATPETNHIFTWPMNNYWVTNFNADQHGEFEWTYQLTSSKDNSDELANKFGWGTRLPLPNRVIPSGVQKEGKLKDGSMLNFSAENLLLISMKPTTDANAVVLHIREITGKETNFTVSSDYVSDIKLSACDPFGKPLTDKIEKSINIKPYEGKFIKLYF